MDPLYPPPLRRLRRVHWIVLDCLAAVLLLGWYLLVWRDLALMRGPRWVDLVILTVAVGPVAVRRLLPRTVLAVVVAGQVVTNLIGAPAEPALAVAFAMYLIPIRLPRRPAAWLAAGSLLAISVGFVVSIHLPHQIPAHDVGAALLVNALLVLVAWTVGDSARQHRLYTAELSHRAEQKAREDLAEARRVISDERVRIARELHDVAAHTMSVIAVQAAVANYVVAQRPEEAARALASIETSSRGALLEMRSLLGILRGDDAEREPVLAPAPGLTDLPDLVARAADIGLRVDLDISGVQTVLAPGLELAAYRVIQEAVTNVIRHAATDRCDVSIRYQLDAVSLEISDAGPGQSAGAVASHGLVGMRERVAMYGGFFHAGPLPGRGFRVTARFPLPSSVA